MGQKPTVRRAILMQLAGGAILATAPIPNLHAFAQVTPVRRNIGDMSATDPTVVTFREGVRLLKARKSTDARSWGRLAAIHGTQAAGFNKCPHGNWYFLPWHRAYLATYERLIRSVTGDPTFAMPFWDWTTHRGLPEAFASPTVGGKTNHLYVAGRVLKTTDVLPDAVVGPAVMSQIRNLTSFDLFGSSRPPGQNSPDVSWLKVGGVQGPMEANPHNQVHGRVGGIMSSGGSPLDPVFMTHHGNLDRIWAEWNGRGGANPAEPIWRDTPFTGHFVTTTGASWSPKVSDLLDETNLGYRYPPSAGLAEPLPAAGAKIGRLLRVLGALQEGSGAGLADTGGALAGGAAIDAVAAPGRPVARGFDVDRKPLDAALAAGAALTDDAPNQVLAFIQGIEPPEIPDVEVRVFVGLANANADTPTNVPNFAGAFGFFGGHHMHGGPMRRSVVMDLTTALQTLRAAGQTIGPQIDIKLVPVSLPHAAGHEFLVGRIDIAVI